MKHPLQQRIAIAAFLIFIATTVFGQANHAIAVEDNVCAPVKIYLMQGSGQSDENSGEMNALEFEISKRVSDVTYKRLSYPFDYPAVLINPLDDHANSDTAFVAFESIISEGGWGVYSDSVNQGVLSLVDDLTDFNRACPDSHIVLAGYSQGAEATGKALNVIPEVVSKQIVYVALFGDPKANMSPNDGINPFDVPWKRGTSLLWSDGILGPKKPYTSDLLKYKTGSWCDYLDGICKGNFLTLSTGAHSRYGEKYAGSAAEEIAAAIRKVKPELVMAQPACGALRQDIVLAINMSPTMRSDDVFFSTDGIKKTVEGAFESGCDVRVGLVEFGRPGVDPTRPVLDFTSDPSAVGQALWNYKNDGTPVTEIERADVLGGVATAMDFTWRESAQKAIIVISDAAGDWYGANDYRDYETRFLRIPAVTNIIKQSRERGGVEVYAVKLDHSPTYNFTFKDTDAVDFYGQMMGLVTKTAGHIGELGYCGQCTWLHRGSSFKSRLADKPVMTVAPVRLKVGESVELAAQDTYGIVAASSANQPWSYRWHVTCGDVLDSKADEPTLTYRPTAAGSCIGAVEVSQSLGYCYRCYEGAQKRRAVTTFPIEVLPADYVAPPLPGAVQNVTKEYLRADKILRVSWGAPANAAEVGEVAYIIKDSDGNIVGVTTATKLHITDVEPDDIPIVTVNTASANGVSEGVSTDDATDLTQPDQEDGAGGVLSANTVEQLRELESGVVPVLSASSPPPTAGSGAVQGAQIADVYTPSASRVGTSPAVTPPTTLRSPSVASLATRPAWLQFTIIAVPLALLTSLGIAAKHGVLLKLRK